MENQDDENKIDKKQYVINCKKGTPINIQANATNGAVLKCYFVINEEKEPVPDKDGFIHEGPDSVRRYYRFLTEKFYGLDDDCERPGVIL